MEEKVEKKRDPLPGEPGHWRYHKDMKAGKDKVTTIDTFSKPKAKEEVKPEPETKLIFTKSEAKALDRKDQETILTKRGVKFSSKDREPALISKILNSNNHN